MMQHQHSGRILTVRTGRILECRTCGQLVPFDELTVVERDLATSAEYRAQQERVMRENEETTRKMMRGEFAPAEHMDRQGEDSIQCPCGNASHLDGFYVSDEQGTILEGEFAPLPEWDGETMACFGCGRIFSLATNVVSGRMTPEMLAGALAFSR